MTLNAALHGVHDAANHRVQHQVRTSAFGGKATGGRVDPSEGEMKSVFFWVPESFLEEENGQEKGEEGKEKKRVFLKG